MKRKKTTTPPAAHTGRPPGRGQGQAAPRTAPAVHDPILVTTSRAAFALIMLFALLLLWRGHNAPGGGFIAGLMTVCALLLHRMATGQSALRGSPLVLIPVGLSLSLLTGLVPYLLGRPFLKTDYGYITTALTGEFEWASAMLFDIGVYLVVVGAGLGMAEALIDVKPTEQVRDDDRLDALADSPGPGSTDSDSPRADGQEDH